MDVPQIVSGVEFLDEVCWISFSNFLFTELIVNMLPPPPKITFVVGKFSHELCAAPSAGNAI